jgi:hypothetical protein
MHLNPKGKELYSQQLAAIVEKVFRKEQSVPISIPWEVPSLVPNDTETQDFNTDDKRSESAESLQQRRKCPVRRNPIFYGHKSPIYSGNKSSQVKQRLPKNLSPKY